MKSKKDNTIDQISDKLLDQCFQKHSNNVGKFVECGLAASKKIKSIGDKSMKRSLFINLKLRECNLRNEEDCEQKAKEMVRRYQEETMKALLKV